MIGLIAPWLLRIGIPERLHRAVTYVALAVLTIVLLWWLVRQYDAAVIERHDEKAEAKATKNRSKSVDEAIADAFTNQRLRDQRDAALDKAEAVEAAKPPEQRATQAPQSVAFNCAIAREDYTPAELAKMPQYEEHCL